MGKQIVFCADGTWNGPTEGVTTSDIDGAAQTDDAVRDGETNVAKLFRNLQGKDTGTEGLANETELLAARRDETLAARTLQAVRCERRQVAVRLAAATGGGWSAQ